MICREQYMSLFCCFNNFSNMHRRQSKNWSKSQDIYLLFYFEKLSLSVALAVLDLALYTRLASYSQKSTCPCLPFSELEGVCHHCLAFKTLIIIETGCKSSRKPRKLIMSTQHGDTHVDLPVNEI